VLIPDSAFSRETGGDYFGNTFYEVWGREIFNDDQFVTKSVRQGLLYDEYFASHLQRSLDVNDLGRSPFTNQYRQNWDTYRDAVYIKETTSTSTTTPYTLRNLMPDTYMECLWFSPASVEVMTSMDIFALNKLDSW
jgi:hypothetical protein